MRSAVVYDSNVYRKLCRGLTTEEAKAKAARIARVEHEAGIRPLASQAVAVELLYHAGRLSDPEHATCLAACCFMYVHCSDEPDAGGVQWLHMADDMMTKALYGIRTSDVSDFAKRITELLAYVAYSPPAKIERARLHIDALRSFVAEVESSFVNLLGRLTGNLQRIPREYRGQFRRLLRSGYGISEASEFLVFRASKAIGAVVDEPSLKDFASTISAKFPVAIAFLIERASRIVDGASHITDGNSAWDLELCFLVGRTITLGASEAARVTLVTNDKSIRLAAEAAELGRFVKDDVAHLAGLIVRRPGGLGN